MKNEEFFQRYNTEVLEMKKTESFTVAYAIGFVFP
jgi:hypothetical protein